MAKTIIIVVLTAIVAGGMVYVLTPRTLVHTSITVEEIKAIAKLGTAECTVSAVRDQEFKSRGIRNPVTGVWTYFTSDYLVVIVRGKITGSVDMEKATVDINEASEDRHVSIHFGRGSVEVSNVEYDPKLPDRVISANEKLGAMFKGSPANFKQREDMISEAKKDLRKGALDAGIVERTMENAKATLGIFVGSLGYRADITFDDKAYDPSAS